MAGLTQKGHPTDISLFQKRLKPKGAGLRNSGLLPMAADIGRSRVRSMEGKPPRKSLPAHFYFLIYDYWSRAGRSTVQTFFRKRFEPKGVSLHSVSLDFQLKRSVLKIAAFANQNLLREHAGSDTSTEKAEAPGSNEPFGQ
jgi:hypothetical protein